MRWIAVCLWVGVAGAALAQSVTVYSEFTRTDPFGKVIRADRGAAEPREILSPAAARGAVSSFHVVVEGDPLDSFTLQVAQNPDNAVKVTAYRERYLKSGDEWVPDVLESVSLPYDGRLMNLDIPRQTAQAFWIDMWVEHNARVERIKVEPQVYMQGGWIRYPMEVRITSAALGGERSTTHAGAESVDDATSVSALRAWVSTQCNPKENKAPEPALSIRNFIARNAGQDVRFAGGVMPSQLLRALGISDRAAFCRAGAKGFSSPEEYLRTRDLLIGARD
jgi:hypothetical protein